MAIGAPLMLLALAALAADDDRDTGATPLVDSAFSAGLYSGIENRVSIERISRHPLVYRAWGVWTLAHPAAAAEQAVLDFAAYPRMYRHVHRCERISQPSGAAAELGTWYLEGRAAMVRIWAIGSIDSLVRPGPGQLRLLASQNEDSSLNALWERDPPGWITFRTQHLRLAGMIAGRGHDSCRVGVVVQAQLNLAVPQWVYRLTMRMVLPGILKGLDEELRRREAAGLNAAP